MAGCFIAAEGQSFISSSIAKLPVQPSLLNHWRKAYWRRRSHHLVVAVTTKCNFGDTLCSCLMTASLPTPLGPEMTMTSGRNAGTCTHEPQHGRVCMSVPERCQPAVTPTGLTVAAVLSCPMLSSSSCKLGTADEAFVSLPLVVVASSVAVLT